MATTGAETRSVAPSSCDPSGSKLEEAFQKLLRRVQLAPGMVHLVEAAPLEFWQELRRGSAQEAAAVKRRIAELEQRKKRLVRPRFSQARGFAPRS